LDRLAGVKFPVIESTDSPLSISVVDGADSEQLENLLYTDIANTAERHELGAGIFDSLGDAAPAFGMVGTLVGLVNMLANMDDPASIGPAMTSRLDTILRAASTASRAPATATVAGSVTRRPSRTAATGHVSRPPAARNSADPATK